MNINWNKITIVGVISLFVLLAAVIVSWFFFFRSSPNTNTPSGTNFGTSANTSTIVTNPTNSGSNNQQSSTQQAASQKIFLIAQGPVAGATLIQTLHPTTTLARYISQNDGHVFDVPLDVPGAVPRVVSNVTIPGASRVVWAGQGSGAILQYIDGGVTVKSVYLGLPPATTSPKVVPTRIQFLPDNIIDLAASPDGASVVYLLKTPNGSDGYIAHSDGTSAKKLFSLPLSQVLIAWPAQAALLITTKNAFDTPGMLFSVDVKTGLVNSLLYGKDITATANKKFTQIMYQTVSDLIGLPQTYVHDVKTGEEGQLPLNPIPEKCIWSSIATSTAYCATPLQLSPADYLDTWHQGIGSLADSLLLFNVDRGITKTIAIPGSIDGGVASDILEMALSADEHYLSFTTKGVRSLWGVRLAQ